MASTTVPFSAPQAKGIMPPPGPSPHAPPFPGPLHVPGKSSAVFERHPHLAGWPQRSPQMGRTPASSPLRPLTAPTGRASEGRSVQGPDSILKALPRPKTPERHRARDAARPYPRNFPAHASAAVAKQQNAERDKSRDAREVESLRSGRVQATTGKDVSPSKKAEVVPSKKQSEAPGKDEAQCKSGEPEKTQPTAPWRSSPPVYVHGWQI
ncbi:hypothetical protein BV25DRAFT_1991832 [Artomyces pyxidatus]|uniref:Uncharacterized protein n=1 Tax=Artomyces pyxidatus TaxID=48021 RepID=A0ACB8T133_9AGAM|nr:hypothetical protein BV25DRAFT_1991832 [Artomyces pyxidatus]